MLKSTLLLATALFLITAPSPDSADLAEATHGLIADSGAATLQAAETVACPPGAAPAGARPAVAIDACTGSLQAP